MTLRAHLIRIKSWWRSIHPSHDLERSLPDYAAAMKHERIAKARNDMKALHAARQQKTAALHANMAGVR